MHRLPLQRRREVGELNALTTITGLRRMRNRKYTECQVIECERSIIGDKVPSFPFLPTLLRAAPSPFYRATSVRGNLLSPKRLLRIFLRIIEKRVESYTCTSNRTDTCQICRFAFQNGTPEAVANDDNVRPSDSLRHLNYVPLLLRLSKRYFDRN